MRSPLTVLLLAGSLLGAGDSLAFGREGHQIVCEVAYRLLDPRVQKKIDKLIAAVPEAHRAAINDLLKRPADTPIKFADSCVWPDAVKHTDEYDATYEWHFINVQREDKVVAMDDCMVGCLLSAIDHHSQILGSHLGDWPRAQALMFLGHWLADIHQPLHVSFADDRGGNDTKVRVLPTPGAMPRANGSCGNLHSIWDFCIIEHSGLSPEEITHQILKELEANPVLDKATGTPLDWANESLALSRSPELGYCRLNGDRCEAIPAPDAKPRELPPDYYRENWPIEEVRMRQAAVRLASLITQLLS